MNAHVKYQWLSERYCRQLDVQEVMAIKERMVDGLACLEHLEGELRTKEALRACLTMTARSADVILARNRDMSDADK